MTLILHEGKIGKTPSSSLCCGAREYGISDVCIGVPVSIDVTGASIEEIDLANSELD